MYRGKDCVEKFVEFMGKEVKRLYATFPQQPMTGLTDALKRERKTAEKCRIIIIIIIIYLFNVDKKVLHSSRQS